MLVLSHCFHDSPDSLFSLEVCLPAELLFAFLSLSDALLHLILMDSGDLCPLLGFPMVCQSHLSFLFLQRPSYNLKEDFCPLHLKMPLWPPAHSVLAVCSSLVASQDPVRNSFTAWLVTSGHLCSKPGHSTHLFRTSTSANLLHFSLPQQLSLPSRPKRFTYLFSLVAPRP